MQNQLDDLEVVEGWFQDRRRALGTIILGIVLGVLTSAVLVAVGAVAWNTLGAAPTLAAAMAALGVAFAVTFMRVD